MVVRMKRAKHGDQCHPKLTQTALTITARRNGYVAKHDGDWSEFVVYPKGRSDLEYRTNELGDAWDTMHAMIRHATI